ncbi:MAG: protein kinase [Gemmataceae bacterium]
MRLVCPRCAQVLDYTQVAPRYCMHCGVALGSSMDTLPAQPFVSPETPTRVISPPPGDPQATLAYGKTGSSAVNAVPASVGNYRLLRTLGSGGMGTVYEAEEAGNGRRVALKLIRHEFVDSRDAVERFRREGRLASALFHPRCVFVLAADEDAGRPYIVMELMPGRTLQDLVQESGPLPVTDAVVKILDVIEGLQEAHRLGFVHRDVKPSNCFLDEEGRVKVGDFGLAKSLVGPEQLTRSGSFLGTVLFASPEQIRNEPVTPQSDVYSVCATLFYLLTGRAPFEDEDPAAALAKAVSDPPASMRTIRPDIPRTLDEVVLRGLARSKRTRWQSLEELRLALIPFVDRSQCVAELGWRVTAFLIDLLLLTPFELAVHKVLHITTYEVGTVFLSFFSGVVCGVAYFAIPEWLIGYSPGKFLMRLRVRDVITGDRPSLWQSLARTSLFYLFRDTLSMVAAFALVFVSARIMSVGEADVATRVILTVLMIALLPFMTGVVGEGILALPMRRRNGYRGIHEFLSGTWVIRLPSARPCLRMPPGNEWCCPAGLPPSVADRVGGYVVQGVTRKSDCEMLLRGEDTSLARPVWLWLRRDCQAILPPVRHDLTRPGRPRWLAGGTQEGWAWEAFIGAPGAPLVELSSRRRPLRWSEALSVLEQLAAELDDAEKDDSLPDRLSPEQIWVQPSGRVLLLDAPTREPTLVATPRDLLRQAAAVALEGQPRRASELTHPIRAPIPWHAAELMTGIMGESGAFSTLGEMRKALYEAHQLPEEISRPGRAMQVGLTMAGLLPGIFCLFALGPILLLLAYLLCVMGAATGELGLEQVEQCLSNERDTQGNGVVVAELIQERERLQGEMQCLESDRTIVLASWSWFVVNNLKSSEDRLRRDYTDRLRLFVQSGEEAEGFDLMLAQGDDLMAGPSGLMQTIREEYHPPLLVFALPLIWALWAGLMRGGVVLHLAGITLVDRCGRPAARWRCALRTLLVWLPVVLLLAGSLALDLWRVATAREGWTPQAVQVVGWLSWHLWWGALVLLVGYIFAAIYWSNRGLHDVLSGVYPVPR